MTQHSRRTFLITSGVAATAGAAAVSGAVPAAAASSGHVAPDHDGSSGSAVRTSVVAYVSDASSGQVTVMSGDREVVVTDHALVRRLTREVG